MDRDLLSRASDALAGRHVEYRFCIGPREIRLLFSSPAFAAVLTPALAHRPAGQGLRPDLTIHVLDGAEAGFDPGFDFPDETRSREVDSPSLFTRSPRRFVSWEPLRRALTVVDTGAKQALYWVPSTGALSPRDRATPFRLVFHRWARTRGFQLVHASGVGTEEGGLLLTGPNGSGKSTAALATLKSELRFAGDDQLLVELVVPRVHSLYSSAGLDAEHLERRLPHLAGLAGTPDPADPEKVPLRLHPDHTELLIRDYPLRAVVVPVVCPGTGTGLSELPTSRALAALAPGTIFQLPGAGGSDFAALAALVRRLPCYELRLGDDLASVPGLLFELLGRPPA